MERGLLWLPLLVLFFWLAWSGWNEYQKVEAYRLWAEHFDRAKYDIYAVLGEKNGVLTWGKPTRKGPVDLKTIALEDVQSIQFLVNGQPTEWAAPPERGRAALQLLDASQAELTQIPFTEPSLAAQWGQYLQKVLQQRH